MLEALYSEKLHLNDLSVPLLVTYDNMLGEHENAKMLIHTLKLHDWEYAVVRISKDYSGHRDKINGYYEFLKTLPAEKYVVLSDSRDVFCCRNPRNFIKGMNFVKSDFIVSMELWCDNTLEVVHTPRPQCVPLTKYWEENKVHSWPLRRYVNSGLIAGKAGKILDFLEYSRTTLKDIKDDQECMGMYMNKFPKNITADSEAIILHTSTFAKCAGASNMYVQSKDSPTFAEIFGRAAFFIHFPSLNTKGQKLMYDTVKLLIENKAYSHTLNSLYGYKEEMYDW
jgi:hypothetical protein